MELALPEYNMGFNRAAWKRLAENKSIADVGLKKSKKNKKIIKISQE